MAPSFGRSISFPHSPARSSSSRRHVRSVSLPSSRAHPLLAHLQNTTRAVRAWAAAPTAPATGLAHLDALLADERNAGAFDFAFVDADKPNYACYHERLLRLVRVGGAIVYDNTLWDGTVALPPDAPLSYHDRRISAAMRDLNAGLSADERVEVCQLTVADGITICRRVV